MKNKLNRIISIILSSIITVTLLTCCAKTESVPEETTVSETTAATIPADLTEEEMAIWESMPEIVFVKFYWDYSDIITGEYIDKYGCIRSFKFDDMPYEPDKAGDFTILDVKKIEQYAEARNVEKVHTRITEHYKIVSDEAIIKKIGQKELLDFYLELLQVNINKKMEYDYFVDNALYGWSCIYGIRKDKNNVDKVIFLREYGHDFLTTKEKHTENLFYALHTVFSQMEPMVGGW